MVQRRWTPKGKGKGGKSKGKGGKDKEEIFADGGAAEHVCSEHHFPGATVRLASRVVLRTADGTLVVTDHVKRVRVRTGNGEGRSHD